MGEPRRIGILELLRASSGSQFIIPVYQRNYTWEAQKEVKQYLNDFESILNGEYNSHFLGIIIYLEKTIDYASRELSIIDGQQRLTTTFLLLYVIKNLFKKNGDKENVDKLNNQYLTNPYDNKIKYKLKPLVSDDSVYRCIVEDRMDDIQDRNSNVIKNYNYILNYLNGLLLKEYALNDILLALDKLNIVVIPISENDNAQRIFESINATGVKLTAADLIRNYLLMNLPSKEQDVYYEKYWRKLEINISQNSKILELFFRMYLAIKKYILVSKNNVYREFVSWNKETNNSIENLFKDLLKYSKIFYELKYKPIADVNKNIKSSIEDFRKMDSDLPLSLFMKFYSLYQDNLIDDNTLNSLYHTINSYMIRRSICDLNSQNISRLFPNVLKKVLEKSKVNYESIVSYLNQELVGNNVDTSGSYMPTDKQMFEMLDGANVYRRPALRIVLERMELYENSAPIDLSALSIEHLMPQTPTEEWLEELDTDIETYNENLHRIGNLTLATKLDNSKMKNLIWNYKNEVLKSTAHLTLNMELIQVDRWNLKRINERTQRMIKRINELYPYPKVDINISNEDNIIEKNMVLDICANLINVDGDINCIKKGSVYKSNNKKKGYIITLSKVYIQGNREKYWFGYREKRFKDIYDCAEQYVLFACRNEKLMVLKMPRKFIEDRVGKLNCSKNDNGSISHYHIVIFKDNEKVSLLLSKPEIKEIDITNYVIYNS